MPASRNDPLGFAERTRKNLAALEAVASIGADVHVVTQVTTSLLGLVAYPWEKQVAKQFKASSLQELVQRGWPAWKFLLGTFETLDDLARHLRNAIAHGRFKFSSDSRELQEVTIEFEDRKRGANAADWRASIRAEHLRDFCSRFIALVDSSEG